MTTLSPSLKKKYCNHCQMAMHAVIRNLFHSPHFAKETCNNCGRFVGFAKNPKNQGKRSKGKHTYSSRSISRCRMCLRPATRLGNCCVLEIHHIMEIQNGGEDTPQNLWVVCSSCDRLIHHQCTYPDAQLQCYYSIQDLQIDMEKDHVPKGVQAQLKLIYKLQEASNASDN